MSDELQKLKSYIRELVNEVEDELEESTTTDNVDGYQTPYAFGDDSNKSKKKTKDVSTQVGYTIVDESKPTIKEGFKSPETKKGLQSLKKIMTDKDFGGLIQLHHREYKGDEMYLIQYIDNSHKPNPFTGKSDAWINIIFNPSDKLEINKILQPILKKYSIRVVESNVTEDTISGGTSDNKTLADIATKHKIDIDDLLSEYRDGIKVEMEHSKNPKIAAEITRDHLYEDPKYYTKLSTIHKNEVNEIAITDKVIKDEIEQFYKLQQEIDRLQSELKQKQAQFDKFDKQIQPIILSVKNIDDKLLTTEKYVVKISRFGGERENASYKNAFTLALTKVNGATKKILDEALEATKTISKISSTYSINKIDEVNIFDKIVQSIKQAAFKFFKLFKTESKNIDDANNSLDKLSKIKIGESINEDDPCWKNYQQIGMKKKNGKDVPNCVPKSESVTEAASVEAYKISRMIGSAQQSTQNFIDDNKIDVKKLESYITNLSIHKKGIIKDIINGSSDKRLNNIKNNFIKQVKESIDESVTELKLNPKKLTQLKKGEKFVFNNTPYEFVELYTDINNAAKVKKEDGKTSVVSFGGGVVNKNTKSGFSNYLKQGGRVWDNVTPTDSKSVTESDTSDISLDKLAKSLGITKKYSGYYIWEKNGGQNPVIMQKTLAKIKSMGWKYVEGKSNAHVANDVVNNDSIYEDSTGRFHIIFHTRYGATPSSNYFTIKLREVKQSNKTTNEGRKPKGPVNRWLELKNDDTQPNKKLSLGLKEIKYKLQEVENFIRWYNKISKMNELSSDSYWKRTNNHIYKIKERLINIARTIQELEK